MPWDKQTEIRLQQLEENCRLAQSRCTTLEKANDQLQDVITNLQEVIATQDETVNRLTQLLDPILEWERDQGMPFFKYDKEIGGVGKHKPVPPDAPESSDDSS